MSEIILVRRGMGYAALWDNGGVELAVDHLRRRSGELHGELLVSAAMSPVMGGRLHRAAFNLSSTASRERLAKSLAARAKLDVPWDIYIEEFCAGVLGAERQGAPIIAVGDLEEPDNDGHLIDPILPVNQASIVYAAGGTGKSYLAVLMAVAVASGTDVLGWHIQQRGPVLYCDWETDQWEVNGRVKRVAAGLGIRAPQILYRTCAGPMDDMAESLSAVVTERGVKLVIVDSVGMAAGAGREGPAEESAIRLFSAFRFLGCTVLAIDHVTSADVKDDRAIAKPYGSIYKVNLARSVWELRGAISDESQAGDGHLALIHRKVNSGRLLGSYGISVCHEPGKVQFAREDITDESLVRVVLSQQQRIARELSTGPRTVAQIAEATGIGEASVRVAVNRARGKSMTRLPDGRWALLATGGGQQG